MKISNLTIDNKEMLSKEQMKNIVGGYVSQCTWTWSGNPGCASGTTVANCNGSASTCQTGADNNCWNNDCCADVDCK